MKPRSFPVERGHILTFARAIGDHNPLFTDAETAKQAGFDDVLAPPTFVQGAAHFDDAYPGRPKPGEPWMGSGREASGSPPNADAGTELHAEQHFEYHRPLHAGETLTVESRPGRSWEKQSARAGTLSFSETIHDYLDDSGQPVITVREVGVRTERPVEQ